MTPELKAQLESTKNLPSPPGVATKIIELANDPNAKMTKIAEALALDPAITTKILRIANSPMYAQARKTENLRQALVVLGLNATFVRCVAMSALISEVFLDQSGEREFKKLGDAARKHLGMNKDTLGEVLTEITLMIPEAEGVFETSILAKTSSESILDEAREALMIRNLAALQTVDNLQEQADTLENRTKELEESSRHDTLTGLYNRRHLDEFMEKAFAASKAGGSPLSIAFADLDKFKSVNDTYGHQIGDQILSTTAGILKASVRSTDIVARYGGEEFILVFPDTDNDLVKQICERIVRSFQETRHDVGVKKDLLVTISVGMATHGDGREFDSLDSFVKAADKALYTAKLQGRNRSVPYDTVAQLKVAQM